MKKRIVVLTLFIICHANFGFTQKKSLSPLAGWWVNTQYEYFKEHSQSEDILFHISPWFIYIDSMGKCTINYLYEQKTDVGYPTSKNETNGGFMFYYKKITLYRIKNNDSLLVYRSGDTPPGAGTIFRRYNR